MPTLEKTIVEKFLASIADTESLNPDQIQQLRELLQGDKKVKADDFVRIFTSPSSGDVK